LTDIKNENSWRFIANPFYTSKERGKKEGEIFLKGERRRAKLGKLCPPSLPFFGGIKGVGYKAT
jgi:hypothetical protein